MLEHPARKKEATLAKTSGQYTIVGPFTLVQGGNGAFLFNPIYVKNKKKKDTFCGGSILVLNGDHFLEKAEIDRLKAASYQYQIWKKDLKTGEKLTISQSNEFSSKDTLKVTCKVPNDTWYFEIVPEDGWVAQSQVIFGILIAALISGGLTAFYWQYEMQRNYWVGGELKAVFEPEVKKQLKYNCVLNVEHRYIICDVTKVREIVLNIISNSVKYT